MLQKSDLKAILKSSIFINREKFYKIKFCSILYYKNKLMIASYKK